MRSFRIRTFVTAGLLLCFATACPSEEGEGTEEKDGDKKADAKKADDKAEKPEDPPEDLSPAIKELDLSGPKPPETSVVLFTVDGALIPIGCFDHEKKKIGGGKDCGKVLPDGESVYLWSEDGQEIDAVGDKKNALCEVADKPTSFSVPTVDSGRNYDWAVWPKSAGTHVEAAPSKSITDSGARLSEVEEKAVTGKIAELAPNSSKGEFRSKQRVELDVDGNDKPEIFVSAIVAHPTDPDRYLFSGLFMAPDGDLGAIQLLDRTKRETDVITLRGTADLAGDGKRELWVGITFDGGSGDRVIELGDKPTPLSKWSCGA